MKSEHRWWEVHRLAHETARPTNNSHMGMCAELLKSVVYKMRMFLFIVRLFFCLFVCLCFCASLAKEMFSVFVFVAGETIRI